MSKATSGITIGTSWTNPNGRTWTVYETLPGGKARIRCGARFGEMYYRDIKLAIAAASA